ncbi:MAG: 50S ribosomal protein L10, partial [Alteraurantiacibacter sp.]|nr:50S ribosomal protein L10 [Alteraurantiacibacter sp.]
MDRSQKAEAVAALNATFKQAGVVVVTRNLGMSVEESTALRTKMREAGAAFKVSKNSLAKLAIADTAYAGIGDMLTGPVALGTSVDPVAAAKVIVEFVKTNETVSYTHL